MSPQTDWEAADKAYLLHHAGCGTCIGAGASPNTLTRCPEGQALWDTYNAAELPAYFSRPRTLGIKPSPRGNTP